MYDRYTIFCEKPELEKFMNAELPVDTFVSYNAGPTQPLPVVALNRQDMIQFFHWGQTQQMANNKALSPRLFNLTKDSAFQRPAYKKAIEKSRCLIAANGFYVWKQLSKKQKAPYFCYQQHHTPFGIAGIYEEFEDLDGNLSHTFNMITVPAQARLGSYSEDMPAILNKQMSEKWLNEELTLDDVSELLDQVTDEKLFMHAVSPRITELENNDQSLIQAAAPSDQFGNYTLFS
ncbi:SOS response-associated peptidase [Marinoscillum sp.]|uniref:SOS response-associated peptidase n=1 Tax=Marinoscillum sp. TaxID=2024838 RepID=UPI003BAA06F9